jgi:hypothetical protein
MSKVFPEGYPPEIDPKVAKIVKPRISLRNLMIHNSKDVFSRTHYLKEVCD